MSEFSGARQKTNRFSLYHIIRCDGGDLLSWEGESGSRMLLAYAPSSRSLVTLEVSEDDCSEPVNEEAFREVVESEFASVYPGKIPLLEAGVDDGLLYGVRDFVPGEPFPDYLDRVKVLPLSEAIDFGVQVVDIALQWRNRPGREVPHIIERGIVGTGDDGALSLKVMGVDVNELVKRSGFEEPLSENELVRETAGVLHRVATGRPVERNGSGRLVPLLGELPEPLRYLMWAAFDPSRQQRPMTLLDLRSLLSRLRDQVPSRPLGEKWKPVCRLEQAIIGKLNVSEAFGERYAEDAVKPEAREFVTSGYSLPVERLPFHYRRRLQVVPGEEMIGEREYEAAVRGVADSAERRDSPFLPTFEVEDWRGFQLVVEDVVNGFSLAELSLRRGGFDAEETLALLEKIDGALGESESQGRVPWNLRAEEIFVNFKTHLARQELLEESRNSLGDWPDFTLAVRLHPTMASLVRGGLLPCSEIDGSASPDGRRLAAVAWQLLSFSRQESKPLVNDEYRPIPRLSSRGNALLEAAITREGGSLDRAAESRREFLAGFRESMGEISLAEAAEPVAIASHESHLTGPVDLLSDPTRPALRSTRRLEQVQPLKRKRRSIGGLIGHVALGGAATFLVAVALVFLHPGTRQYAFAQVEPFLDAVSGTEERGAGESFLEGSAKVSQVEKANVEMVSHAPAGRPSGEGTEGEGLVGAEDAEFACVPPEEAEVSLFPEPLEKRKGQGFDELLELLARSGVELDQVSEEALRGGVEDGSNFARYELGRRLLENSPGEAAELLMDSAISGHAGAAMLYGRCLLDGSGMAADEFEGLKWVRSAAESGNLEAMELIGSRVVQGNNVPGVGFVEGKQYLTAASERGSGNAASLLGAMYLNGLGVEKDEERAYSLFERSARAGDVEGMLYYARCLHAGIGTTVDEGKSAEWFARAARAGNEKAIEWCREKGMPLDPAGVPGA